MTSEKALELALPNIIVIGGIVIAVTIWICRMLSAPQNKRIPILLNGIAFVTLVIGYAISIGPNPKYQVNYSNSRVGGIVSSGPKWGLLIGAPTALVIALIARHCAKIADEDEKLRERRDRSDRRIH